MDLLATLDRSFHHPKRVSHARYSTAFSDNYIPSTTAQKAGNPPSQPRLSLQPELCALPCERWSSTYRIDGSR